MKKRLTKLIILSVVFVFLSLIFACQQENLKPGSTAFIEVDHFNLTTNYITNGSNSHKITDVWVYADDQTIGVFELPITIPILKSGIGKLRLEAGIKLNGIKTTRVNNPFYEPVIIEPFNFIIDSTILLSPTTTYRPQTVFVWMEDFESDVISLDTTRLTSDVTVVKSTSSQAFEGSSSGMIALNKDNSVFEAATFEAYVLPTTGKPVFLEMDYKNDFNFTVGIFSQTENQILKKEVIYLLPKEDWNKIYINLTDKLTESQNAIDFKVFFRTALPEEIDTATIFLDNLKLIYR